MHLFEFFYYLGFSAIKYGSLRKRKRLPNKVISVGNLTVGGTGKTPVAIALAEKAKIRGFRPVILTRGYKGSARGPCFVSRGEGPILTAAEAGDEPFLMAKKLEGVAVVKARDRYEAGMFALNEIVNGHSLIFILDDGFQHFGLHRDKDILLINAVDPFGNRRILPLGPLREPVDAIGRAHVIVLTNVQKENGDSAGDNIIKEVRRHNRDAPVFFSRHTPVRLRLASGELLSLEALSGKKAFGFCGLGRPEGFLSTLKNLGAEIAGHRFFRDHHAYTAADIFAIKTVAKSRGAEWIVTTEKDIMKLDLDLPDNILIIEIEFSVEGEFYDNVFAD